MAEFKEIKTQEEFDAAIKERLDRNTKSVTAEVTKKYEGYISPDDLAAKIKESTDKIAELTKQAAEKDKSIADLTTENKNYKLNALKTKIAHEKGLPYELAERLTGDTEEALGKDAEALAKYVSSSTAPLGSPEVPPPTAKSGINAALESVLSEMTK